MTYGRRVEHGLAKCNPYWSLSPPLPVHMISQHSLGMLKALCVVHVQNPTSLCLCCCLSGSGTRCLFKLRGHTGLGLGVDPVSPTASQYVGPRSKESSRVWREEGGAESSPDEGRAHRAQKTIQSTHSCRQGTMRQRKLLNKYTLHDWQSC